MHHREIICPIRPTRLICLTEIWYGRFCVVSRRPDVGAPGGQSGVRDGESAVGSPVILSEAKNLGLSPFAKEPERDSSLRSE